MYQFDYAEVCEELSSESIPKPRRLADAIELMEAAQAAPSSSHELLGVLSDFRRLWLTILEDMPPCSQDMTANTKPHISDLAGGVLQEIERCRFQKKEAVPFAWAGKWPQ